MELESLYREVIMAHHQNPFGRLPLNHVDCSAHGYNSSCGDEYTVNIELKGDVVEGIQIEGNGCAISGAAGSMLGQVAKGMTLQQLKELISKYRNMLTSGEADETLPGDLPALAGVNKFPVRIKCASLPMTTTLDAINQLQK
ncbi:MAG: SUF system NifU family Fe-S cluster assembly protein [Deltaproteobacteria bacterium]|nr:SUF system NifU family Fe-S cluster assembly protein [Deltaproteobacteria bacterium]